MTPYDAIAMAFSDRAGWDKLRSRPLRLDRIATRVALPLSLLPPAMIYLAGTHHGDDFLPGIAARPWGLIAAVFFLAEWLSIALMGPVVKAVAAAHGIRYGSRDAYLLALLPPIPMWVSSLGLLSPNLLTAFAIALVGLALAVGITYQGIRASRRVRDDLVAMSMTQGIAGVGLATWGLLLAILIPA